MNTDKRKLNYNQSSEKRNRIDHSISSIENLPNELFNEIFDYLDTYHMHQAFYNLNYRFQRLINSLSRSFEITFRRSKSEQMILFDKNQIPFIHFLSSIHTKTISSSDFDSSFNRFESLIFHSDELDILISVLSKLTHLPRLFSLTINIGNISADLTDIYRSIFDLPKLKYVKFIAMGPEVSVSLPCCIHKQVNNIKHLIMNHSITLNNLFSILSYTTQVENLSFTHKMCRTFDTALMSPIMLPNLTYLSIYGTDLRFDAFEIFITKIHSKLKVLSLENPAKDMNYLNADRWEKLILKYLSQLEKFYLICEFLGSCRRNERHISTSNSFNSSFWIERQWIFETEINLETFIYSIHPYKKRWFEYDSQYNMINSSKFMQIVFTFICYTEECYFLRHISTAGEVYHLKIHEDVCATELIKILNLLPYLDSLQLSSLPFADPKHMINEERELLSMVTCQNQITKVYLRKMLRIEDIYFLIELCPRMTYLKVDFSNHMDIEDNIPKILIKINTKYSHHIRLLCFRVVVADEKLVENLKRMIHFEKFFSDYKIKRVFDNIYIEWK
ncbi:unnamed protein product [Adineta steineri]|uniref:F-box domain-containing protein n=1 Tax=Adineta steineri TaxID=433720 RepID=A0A814D3R6_9BILA|nr:unnamed protein product [Adineta steineri]CAF3944843.1 unnamed protein product [Adineta steineri]